MQIRHASSSSPHQPGLRLERWHRRAVYGVLIWLTATGLLWLAAHFLMRPVSEFGEGVHPLEPWSMKLHGAGAMLALFFIGSVLNSHIRRAVRARRNLVLGWSLLAAFALLVLTGYALYYAAGEQLRPIWSVSHWLVGLLLPLVFVLHLVRGRAAARKADAREGQTARRLH